MTTEQIRDSIAGVVRHFTENPEKAKSRDTAAIAVMRGGLSCRAEGPNGAVLVTDMPKGIGGGGTAPTPGWYLRAALATCDATVIAMRAAQLGVTLSKLEVTVDSESDNRGLVGIEGVPAGPLAMRVRVLVGSNDADADLLRDIVGWAEAHSPVGDAVRRAIPSKMEIEID